MQQSTHPASPARRPEPHLEPSRIWILGVALEADQTVAAAPAISASLDGHGWPAPAPDEASTFGTCACPDACPRDHPNE